MRTHLIMTALAALLLSSACSHTQQIAQPAEQAPLVVAGSTLVYAASFMGTPYELRVHVEENAPELALNWQMLGPFESAGRLHVTDAGLRDSLALDDRLRRGDHLDLDACSFRLSDRAFTDLVENDEVSLSIDGNQPTTFNVMRKYERSFVRGDGEQLAEVLVAQSSGMWFTVVNDKSAPFIVSQNLGFQSELRAVE